MHPVAADFDPARLQGWLQRQVPGLKGGMRLERIGGGQSNPTFFASFDNRELVLRKKPAGGNLLPSAHAVDREYRVLNALAGSGVPVPATVLYCGDAGVIGTPFYLMERLHGRIFPAYALAEAPQVERRAMYRSMAETLAALHGVDWRAAGLDGYGKPGNYFERQIGRWTKQWHMSKTAENADIEHLIRWLPRHIPANDDTAIAHGDFRFGNLMFHPTEPRVIAVLDWELSTLGHPLADVAYNCMAWLTHPDEFGGLRGTDLEAQGIPSMKEHLDDYRRASGREDGITGFHLAFSLFRFAVILEGIAARARDGSAAAADAEQVGGQAGIFAKRAVEAADWT
ncbi:phosphotransferase family protein [Noviherbaspirillum pedocola]|uniref:Phosphotransferase family protein n=1 Tax=Noviherbaspirillum pedocola TaxID=2801341 RepID=A0A934T3A5_9BURK|nr:phosphotransferase family protein [Noviherbaspirillum pedocola]MBK4738719.1 phosphotransferase family protein [Noviherbaspirillum pedocola]